MKDKMKIKKINNKGQIDQIITSVVIIFVVFFLMLIFVIVSANIAGVLGLLEKDAMPGEVVAPSSQAIGSQVLMELFLTDEVEINGKKVLVVDALRKMVGASEDEGKIFANVIQDKFHTYYACGGENVFIVDKINSIRAARGHTHSVKKRIYINYPEVRTVMFDDVTRLIPGNDLNFEIRNELEGEFRKEIKLDEENSFTVTTKENVRC